MVLWFGPSSTKNVDGPQRAIFPRSTGSSLFPEHSRGRKARKERQRAKRVARSKPTDGPSPPLGVPLRSSFRPLCIRVFDHLSIIIKGPLIFFSRQRFTIERYVGIWLKHPSFPQVTASSFFAFVLMTSGSLSLYFFMLLSIRCYYLSFSCSSIAFPFPFFSRRIFRFLELRG